MRVCAFEDQKVEQFEPLVWTRPVFDLLCGMSSLAEKHARRLPPAASRGVLIRPYLADLFKANHPETAVNDVPWLRSGPVLLVNGRWLAPEGFAADFAAPHLGLVGEELAYAYIEPAHLSACVITNIDRCLEVWKDMLPRRQAGGVLLNRPWDLVEHNAAELRRDFLSLPGAEPPRPNGWFVLGPPDRLHVAPTGKVEPLAVLDTTPGPIVIADGAVVAAFSRIEGPCYIGPGTQVKGAKVSGGVTFGPQCRIGGEVEATIVHGYSNKYHDGFLGHSYVGEWVNLGAGTSNSDLRNDYGEVKVPVYQVPTRTGLSKVGCFLGDHTKTGLGTLINTGTNVGIFANLLPAGMLAPKYVPPFTNLWKGELREGPDFDAHMATAARVMPRRGRQLTEHHVALYRHLYEATAFLRHGVLQESGVKKVHRSA